MTLHAMLLELTRMELHSSEGERARDEVEDSAVPAVGVASPGAAHGAEPCEAFPA